MLIAKDCQSNIGGRCKVSGKRCCLLPTSSFAACPNPPKSKKGGKSKR